MLRVAGYSLYGPAWDIEWCPGDPHPLGFHPGNPPDVARIYWAYLKSARKKWGTTHTLVHRRELVLTLRWARRVVAHRDRRRQRYAGILE